MFQLHKWKSMPTNLLTKILFDYCDIQTIIYVASFFCLNPSEEQIENAKKYDLENYLYKNTMLGYNFFISSGRFPIPYKTSFSRIFNPSKESILERCPSCPKKVLIISTCSKKEKPSCSCKLKGEYVKRVYIKNKIIVFFGYFNYSENIKKLRKSQNFFLSSTK